MSTDQGSYAELSQDWASDPWFRFPRAFIRDKRLTWEARAIAAWMASHDASFRFSVDYIVQNGSAGRDKVRRVMRDLEVAGYLERGRARNEDGSFGPIVYRLHPRSLNEKNEIPRSEPAPEIQGVVNAAPEPAPKPEPQTRRSEPAPDLPAPVNQEGYKKKEREREGTPSREFPPSIDRRSEAGRPGPATPTRPAPWALDLIARLPWPDGTRPNRRDHDSLAGLVQAAVDDHGLTAADLAAHLAGKLGRARKNPVAYLRGALAPDELPVPTPPAEPVAADEPAKAPEVPAARPKLPTWCGQCGQGSGQAAKVNSALRAVDIVDPDTGRVTHRIKCPDCHPDNNRPHLSVA